MKKTIKQAQLEWLEMVQNNIQKQMRHYFNADGSIETIKLLPLIFELSKVNTELLITLLKFNINQTCDCESPIIEKKTEITH